MSAYQDLSPTITGATPIEALPAATRKLPSIYTVARTVTGYQPMRNGRPHFGEFTDFISAHLACKTAETRQEARYRRNSAIAAMRFRNAALTSQASGEGQ